MKIQINNKPVECTDGALLTDVVAMLNLPETGVAIAVNNRMVPRAQWPFHTMEDGDSLVVVRAAGDG